MEINCVEYGEYIILINYVLLGKNLSSSLLLSKGDLRVSHTCRYWRAGLYITWAMATTPRGSKCLCQQEQRRLG